MVLLNSIPIIGFQKASSTAIKDLIAAKQSPVAVAVSVIAVPHFSHTNETFTVIRKQILAALSTHFLDTQRGVPIAL